MQDTSATLERSVQNTLAQLTQLDRTVSHRRWDLNQLLGAVASKSGAHADSALGREILQVRWVGRVKSSEVQGGEEGGPLAPAVHCSGGPVL